METLTATATTSPSTPVAATKADIVSAFVPFLTALLSKALHQPTTTIEGDLSIALAILNAAGVHLA